ncbi:MAG: hypothetical protein SXV54_25905, partial [Chloroflexota bacterium]|nr:hypothetical protein [Chloroflexota bacterium]
YPEIFTSRITEVPDNGYAYSRLLRYDFTGLLWVRLYETLHVSGFYISAETESPGACWQWIKFLSTTQLGLEDSLPVRWSALQDPTLEARMGEEALAAYRIVLQSESLTPHDPLPVWVYEIPYYWLRDAFREVLEGADPAAVLAEAQVEAQVWVDCLNQAGDDEEQRQACYQNAGLLE